MLSLVPLFIAAGTVGIVHMAAPDHWVTLAILGRSKKWSRARVFRTSLFASIGHVLLSLALAVGVAAVGIAVSNVIAGYLDIAIGIVMLLVGMVIGIRPIISKKQDVHHYHVHDTEKYEKAAIPNKIGYFAVLGAALSPDPSIVPVFLASIPGGFYFLAELAALFAVTSVLTLVVLVQLGNMGFAKALERIPQKYNDSLVGFVIAAIGIFILVTAH